MTSAFLSIATRTTHIIFHSLSTRPSIHSLFYQLILHEAMMSIQAILMLVVLAISAVDRTLAGVATAYGGANQVRRRIPFFLGGACANSPRLDGALGPTGRLACADRNLVAPGVDAARVTPFSTLGVASDPLAHINPFLNRSRSTVPARTPAASTRRVWAKRGTRTTRP